MLGISRGYPRLAGLFAWAAMVLFLASGFGIRYLAGTLGDPDISNLVEAVFIPVVVMSLPLGAVALGVYAPCVQALGTMMGRVLSVPEHAVARRDARRGRTCRDQPRKLFAPSCPFATSREVDQALCSVCPTD